MSVLERCSYIPLGSKIFPLATSRRCNFFDFRGPDMVDFRLGVSASSKIQAKDGGIDKGVSTISTCNFKNYLGPFVD